MTRPSRSRRATAWNIEMKTWRGSRSPLTRRRSGRFPPFSRPMPFRLEAADHRLRRPDSPKYVAVRLKEAPGRVLRRVLRAGIFQYHGAWKRESGGQCAQGACGGAADLGGAQVAGAVGRSPPTTLNMCTPKSRPCGKRLWWPWCFQGVSFFLNHGRRPGVALIDGGVPVAIASDFNPGRACRSPFLLTTTIARTHMRMSPGGGPHGDHPETPPLRWGVPVRAGSIEPGSRRLWRTCRTDRHMAYHFGVNHIRHTIKNGTLLELRSASPSSSTCVPNFRRRSHDPAVIERIAAAVRAFWG